MITVVGVFLAILLALYTVPVSTSFTEQLTATRNLRGVAYLDPPKGSSVSGTFTTTDGGSVTFEILTSSGNVVYSTDSNHGSFTFTASSPPYWFDATTTFLTHTVDVTGHYTAPILPGAG